MPARCSALAPSIATAMASSHMRMRPQSPMLTQSDTAPMVQKLVLLATAPKMKASTKAPATTSVAGWVAASNVVLLVECRILPDPSCLQGPAAPATRAIVSAG